MTDKTILAVGAAGQFAGLAVAALSERHARVRGLVRNAEQGKKAQRLGAAEVIIGDVRDARSVDAALAGVDAVFYIAPAFLPDEAEVGKRFVDAVKRSGARRIVFSSVIHPMLAQLANHAAKAPVEAAILDSGLEYTFLHPTLYFQNFATAWPKVVADGVLAEPWSSETRFSRVDYRDVAEVAAIALLEERLLHGTFELCAEGTLNRHEVAALIAEVIGRDVRADRLDPDTLGKEAEALRPMFAYYDQHGLVGSSLTLRSILGRAPRTLRAYFEELAREEIRHALSDNDRRSVAAMRAAVAPLKGTMSGPDARAPFDDVMEHTPDAPGVRYETSTLNGIPGIWCAPDGSDRKAAILYLHGGAYVLGSARPYRHFAGQIADRSNAAVFIAQYRLAPEHPFPAALDDAKAAYRGLVESGARMIAIVGDSAGGGLALTLLSVLASESVAPVAAVVMSPWTDFALTGDSLEARADEDPLLTKEMLSKAAGSYLRGHDPRDPLASPLYGDLAGRPPIQLHIGTSEILLDDARRYAERARSAGVEVSLHIWEGMTHVFASSVGTLEAAEKALTLMGSFIGAKLGTRPLPTGQIALPGVNASQR